MKGAPLTNTPLTNFEPPAPFISSLISHCKPNPSIKQTQTRSTPLDIFHASEEPTDKANGGIPSPNHSACTS